MKNRVYKYYSDLRIIEYDQPSGITNGHSPTLDYRAVHNQYENLKKKKNTTLYSPNCKTYIW